MTRTPRQVVEELVDAYNAKSLERLRALYRPDARFWDPFHRAGVVGQDAIEHVLDGLFQRYPDEQMSIVTLVADSTHAVAELRSTGHSADGRAFDLDFTEVYEVEDGRIVSCRVYIDPRAVPG